jgi:hypothetical protein
MSTKNKLQEYCQKSKISFPSYDTKRIGGDDTYPAKPAGREASPMFESTVVFKNQTFKAIGHTKIEAEKLVASQICETLERDIVVARLRQKYADIRDIPMDSLINPASTQGSQCYQTIYLIDGDNYTISEEEEKVFEEPDSLFIYFVAKNNTRPQPIQQQHKHDNCCVFISDSVSRDAVDHFITFSLGKMSILWNEKKYYILTRDHFGECLQRFIPNCKFICSINDR